MCVAKQSDDKACVSAVISTYAKQAGLSHVGYIRSDDHMIPFLRRKEAA